MAEDRREFGRFLMELRLKDLDGRKAIIADLRRRKGERSVALLLEILCDESWYLRELAIEALGEMDEIAIAPLLTLLRSGLWYSRASAAKALGLIGDRRTVLPLAALLDDANTTVAAAGAEGLIGLCRRGLSLAVARALRSRPAEARERALALMRRTDPDGGRKLAALAGSDAWMGALGELGEETVEAQVAASSDRDEGLSWDEIAGPLPPPRKTSPPPDASRDAPNEEDAPDAPGDPG